jgi:uncharacterized protein YbjT (DUF2867 family)
MFVVAGVTGHTGSAVASTLLARGESVRVLVRREEQGRKWKERGAMVALGSLDDPGLLAKALAGAAGAYLLVPPDMKSERVLARGKEMVTSMVEALAKAKVPHVAFLSSIGAHVAEGTGPIRQLHHAEREFRKTDGVFTFVRASYFMENLEGMLTPVREQGVLPVFVDPDRKFPMVATADIGRTAAQALLSPPQATQVLELAGPRDCTFREAAQSFARHLGRTVDVARVPPEAIVATFTHAGLSLDLAGLYREMLSGMESGLVAFEDGARTKMLRGTIALDECIAKMLALRHEAARL